MGVRTDIVGGECASGLTDVPALREDDAQGEKEEEEAGACPSVGYEGCCFVEVGLV